MIELPWLQAIIYFSQENAPYNKGAFRIEINFPAEYPFKPPKIAFKTKIYHPNIDEKGQVKMLILNFYNILFVWQFLLGLQKFIPSGIACHTYYCVYFDNLFQVCLPIISAENWKPATKTDQVIQALVALVNDPEPEHPLRADLAEEYSKDKKKFMKNAEEFTKKNSEKRPSD